MNEALMEDSINASLFSLSGLSSYQPTAMM
jgi:hypothetical protein